MGTSSPSTSDAFPSLNDQLTPECLPRRGPATNWGCPALVFHCNYIKWLGTLGRRDAYLRRHVVGCPSAENNSISSQFTKNLPAPWRHLNSFELRFAE